MTKKSHGTLAVVVLSERHVSLLQKISLLLKSPSTLLIAIRTWKQESEWKSKV